MGNVHTTSTSTSTTTRRTGASRATRIAVALGVTTASLTAMTAMAAPAEARLTMRVPARLHALSSTASTLKLDWAYVRHAKGYRIQYSTSSTMTGAKYARFKASTGTLRGLAPSTTYWFRVRVIDPRTGADRSRYTKPTFPSATTKAAPASTTTATPPTSTPAPGDSDGPADVRVGSFNISDVSNDSKAAGELHVWRERRPGVVDEILGQRADVVGLQEANMSTIHSSQLDFGDTQYDDLVGAINARGAHYAVTDTDSYNCQRAWSSQNCDYVYRGASNSTRILYNTDTLEPVLTGSYRYQHQTAGRIDRYLAWGVFRVKATGGEFFFADTHLDSSDKVARQQEWSELIDQVNTLRNGRPVVVVGDFNTSKFDTWAEKYLPLMKSEGYGDVLDQHYAQTLSPGARPQHLINSWVNSFNGYRRDVGVYSYKTKRDHIGNNIDWVFASNNLVVKEWQTVVNYNPDTLQVNGIIPSDHNMVRATITIP